MILNNDLLLNEFQSYFKNMDYQDFMIVFALVLSKACALTDKINVNSEEENTCRNCPITSSLCRRIKLWIDMHTKQEEDG